VLAGLGLLVAAWTLLALVLGRDNARNPVPWVVYVLLWVGLVPLSVLLGRYGGS
jgi:Ni/Fe-hydrogenase subunit HybB-like protein